MENSTLQTDQESGNSLLGLGSRMLLSPPRTLPDRPETYPGDSSDKFHRAEAGPGGGTPGSWSVHANQMDSDHQCENREDIIFISKCQNGAIGPGFRWCTNPIKPTGTTAE